MSPDESKLHRASRHLPIAQALAGADEKTILRKFAEERVLIIGSPARIRTRMGRLMLDTAVNLISRFATSIDLSLGTGMEQAELEVRQLLLGIDSSLSIRRVGTWDSASYAAILSVGTDPTRTVGATSIDSCGWLALVSDCGILPMAEHTGDGNPFGAMAAAALGAAEVFKHLVGLRSDKGGFFGTTSFSTFDYGIESANPGPPIPEQLVLPPTLLAGVGAVGNGFLLALSEVPRVSGELVVVDNQMLDDPSNLNRYALACEADVDLTHLRPKTMLATRLFSSSSVLVRPFQIDVKEIASKLRMERMARPQVIVCALDNNPSRYELQDLWPDLLIEGATGETLLQVSRHEYERALACIRCLHPEPPARTASYEERLQQVSGLPLEWIQAACTDPSLPLTSEALAQTGGSMKELLAQRVGSPACSVLAEIEQLSTRPPAELPFQPTVSFVSAIAGILAAAEYAKYVIGLGTTLGTFFQVDLMFPLKNSFLQTVQKVPGCYCVERKDVIARYRREA